MDRQLVVSDVAVLAEAMAHIAHHRPDIDGFADALGTSQVNLTDAIEQGTQQLVNIIGTRQHRTVLRYDEFRLPIGDPRLWLLVGMLRELGNRGPVTIDLDDGAAEPKWLRYLHPRVQLAGPPGAGTQFGDSRPRVPRDRLANGSLFQRVFSSDPGYQLPAAALHVHDARWSPGDPVPDHATQVLRADGMLIDVATGHPLVDGFPWWSASLNWDPVIPRRSKTREAPWIAVVAAEQLANAARTLIAAVSHVARLPVRVFETPEQTLPLKLLASLRADPPAMVLQIGQPATNSAVSEWCAVTGISCRMELSAHSAMQAVVDFPAPAFEEPRWQESLDCLYAK